MIETLFGDSKQHGGTIRQVKLRGRAKVSDVFTLAMLAVNLRRAAEPAGDAGGHGWKWIDGRGASACAIRPEIAANPVQAKAQTRAIPLVVADSFENAPSRRIQGCSNHRQIQHGRPRRRGLAGGRYEAPSALCEYFGGALPFRVRDEEVVKAQVVGIVAMGCRRPSLPCPSFAKASRACRFLSRRGECSRLAPDLVVECRGAQVVELFRLVGRESPHECAAVARERDKALLTKRLQRFAERSSAVPKWAARVLSFRCSPAAMLPSKIIRSRTCVFERRT